MRDPLTTPFDAADADPDPLAQFRLWLADAERAVGDEAVSMALATATPDGAPSVRIVLMRGLDERGLVFYTNLESRKGDELRANPRAALVFHWPPLERQVRIEGRVETVAAAEADAYFASRPLGHRFSAAASPQSRVVPDRRALEAAVERLLAEHPHGHPPRPDFWGGYRLVPGAWEFWQGRKHRLHDRIRYRPDGTGWRRERLAP